MTRLKLCLTTISFILLAGCQISPNQPAIKQQTVKQQDPESNSQQQSQARVKVTPYPDNGIVKESHPLPTHQPPRVILPQQQSTQSQQALKDGRGIAAYQKLMSDYLQSLNNNDIASAESYLLQAQRIAPQSADVYRELARIANLKKQGANAEAFARKGLTFAQNNTVRKQLWQQILQSAQLRNHALLIQQAQQRIAQY